jgi:O-antigen ligase/capsular polysaccharide biosynthesis protein
LPRLLLFDLLLVRQRRTFLVTFALVLAAAAVFIASRPEEYKGTATLFVGENRPIATGADALKLDDALADSYVTLLQTSDVEREVRRTLPFPLVGGMIDVARVPGTRLIEINAFDRDPAHAQQIATTYATAFVARRERSAAAAAEGLAELVRQVRRGTLDLVRLPGGGAVQTSSRRASLEVRIQAARSSYLQARHSRALQGADVSVSSRAAEPLAPARPRRKLLVVVALMLAALVAGVAAALRNVTDHRFRDEQELTETMGLPVLARIPRAAAAREPGRDDGAMREAFDILRANLRARDAGARRRVIAVVGPAGPSTTHTLTTRLSEALSDAGQTAVVAGAASGEGGPVVAENLGELARDHDWVLIDASAPDVAFGLEQVTGIVLVIDLQTSSRPTLSALREQLSRSDAEILGMVLVGPGQRGPVSAGGAEAAGVGGRVRRVSRRGLGALGTVGPGVAAAALGALAIAAAYRTQPVLPLGLLAVAAAVVLALSRPIVVLLFAVVLIPLDLFALPLGGAGITATEALFALCGCGWATRRIAQGQPPLVANPLNGPAAMLILVAFAGVLVSAEPAKVIHVGVVWILCALVFQLVVDDGRPQTVQRLLVLLTIAGGAVSAFAIVHSGGQVQQITSLGDQAVGRAVGALGDPNLLGMFLALTLPGALAVGLAGPLSLRPLGLAAVALIVLGLALSLSRGGFLAGAGALAVMLTGKQFRRVALAAVVILAALTIVNANPLSGVQQVQTVATRVLSVQYAGQSQGDQRLTIYKVTPSIIADHPFLGVGANGFSTVAPRYGIVDPISGNTFAHAHNIVLTIGAELGLAGLVALGWLVLRLGRVLWRGARSPRHRVLGISVAASFAALSLQGLLDYTLRSNVIAVTTAVLAGCAVVIARSAEEEGPSEGARFSFSPRPPIAPGSGPT